MISTLKKLFKIFNRSQKIKILWMGVLILIGGVLETLSVSMILPLVTAITNIKTMMENKYVKIICDITGIYDENSFVILMLVAVIIMFIVKNAFLLLSSFIQARFVSKEQAKTVSYLLEETLNRPYEFYLNADIPTVFRTVDNDVPMVFTVLMEYIRLATEGVVAVMLCIVLLKVDYKMTLLMGCILLGMTVIILKVLRPLLGKMGVENQHIHSQMGKWKLQSIYGIKDVKTLHKERFFVSHFEDYSYRLADITGRYAVFNNMPRLLIETMCIAGILSYLIVCILSGRDVSTLVPQLTTFAVAAVRLMPSVTRMNTYVTNIVFYKPNVDYVYENVDFSKYKKYGEYRYSDNSKIDDIPISGMIELKDVFFKYPGSDKYILEGINIDIPIGKSVGIVGPSGSGKSTTVDVILGLLHAEKGKILCGGVDVFDNYPKWLSHIGYIPQQIFLTDEAIRENVAFGVAPEDIDDDRVWAVLEEAQLTEYVKELDEGIYTKTGERGVRMSGGQRQRLGIARALYHDPEILIFDEATSALDNDTEAAIMEAIDQFHGRKTMMIIAHRLHTIENCDIILKVDEGKVTETTINS